MMISRRQALSTLVASGGAFRAPGVSAQSTDQWFAIQGDDGNPVPNMRLPVEVASEVDELEGAIWVGSPSREITLVEFFDYNCPYCRKAMPDLHGLMREVPDLRLGLVNNAILSPSSEDAARIEMAVLRLGGPQRAYEFHCLLFERRGVIDLTKALEVAEGLGAPRTEIETRANAAETKEALSAQMRLAASLGMAATPSFLVGGVGLFGYPGPGSLKGIIGNVRECGEIEC